MKKWISLVFCLPLGLFAVCAGVNWDPAQDLFNVAGQTATLPAIAVNDNGQAIAAWINTTSGSTPTVQARYRSTTGIWGTMVNLSTGTVTLNTPAVGIDSDGNAVVAWSQGAGTLNVVQAAIYPASNNAWILPGTKQLSPSGSNAVHVVAAMDETDHAVVGWCLSGGALQATTVDLQGNNSGVVSVSGSEQTFYPNLASNAKGDVLVTWVNTQTGGVEASFKMNGEAWTLSPYQVSPVPSTHVTQSPTSAIDDLGNAVIAWSLLNSTDQTTIYTSQKLVTEMFWESPITLSITAANTPLQEVGMDNKGNLSAVWIEHPTNMSVFNEVVLTATKTFGATAWTFGEFLSNPIYEVEDCLSFGVDSSNDAIGVWTYDKTATYPGAVAALSRPACSTPAWIFPETILSGNGSNPTTCGLSLNDVGFAISIWGTTIGTNGIIQVSNGSFPLNDVTNLVGVQLENDFALIFEFYDRLTWQSSTSPGVTGYHIYQDGVLAATLPNTAIEAEFHDQVKDKPVTYTVKAFNAQGQESPGASVTVN